MRIIAILRGQSAMSKAGTSRKGCGGAGLASSCWRRQRIGQGCVEMASDTQIDNGLSLRVHESLGFRVVERAILFHKSLR
jgi:aminoglycoside 6'-N-acetyltransferase I